MPSTKPTGSRTLESGERESFTRDGYLILKGFFPEEQIISVARETESLLDRTDLIAFENLRCWFQLHCDTDEWLFDSFEPVTDISQACARLATDMRLLALMSSLY